MNTHVDIGKAAAVREDAPHVAVSGLPTCELTAARTERVFVCHSAKMRSSKTPRTWQGRGRLAELRAFMGTSAAVFERVERALGNRAASAPPCRPESVTADDGRGTGAAGPSDLRENDCGDDGGPAGSDASGAPRGSAFTRLSQKRYSAPSNVGAASFNVAAGAPQ